MVIDTPRTRLRCWQVTDREAFAAMNADPEVMADLGGPLTRVESDAKLDRYAAAFTQYGLSRLVIESGEGAFLGYAGVMPRPDHQIGAHFDVGWRLVRHAWGHGYATEAAAAALNDAFSRVGLAEVLAYTAPDNVRSQAVMARLPLQRDPSRDFTAQYRGRGGLARIGLGGPATRRPANMRGEPMAIGQDGLTPAERRYLGLAQRFRSEMPEDPTFNAPRGAKRYAGTIGLLEFQDAMVLGGEWLVVVGGEVFCDFFVQMPSPPETAYLTRFGFDDAVIELIHERPRDPAISKAFLLGGCRNYSHWLLDYLPRMRLRDDVSPPLIVNGPIAGFQSEALKFLGVDDDELIQLEYPATLSVQHLFYPSTCSSSVTPPHPFRPEILTWLRETFAPLMTSDREERRIFISRAEEVQAWRRRLLNHEEIESIAKRHDFEIVALEKLGFAEQVGLFSNASVIAGAHGAGFSNMVFAPAGTKLVELIGPKLSDSPWSMEYAGIAARSGQDFTRIVGQGGEQDPVAFDHLPYETYVIDPKEFESVLDA